VAFTQPGGGSGSKNPFPSFGTLFGKPVERSDANVHLPRDFLPAGALRSQFGNPVGIHDALWASQRFPFAKGSYSSDDAAHA